MTTTHTGGDAHQAKPEPTGDDSLRLKRRGLGIFSRSVAWPVAIVAALGVAFSWLLPDVGDAGRFVEMLNWLAFCGRTFGFHLGVGLTLLLVLMALRRTWKPAIIVALTACWCFWPAAASYVPKSSPDVLGSPRFTLYSVNAQVGFVDGPLLQKEIEQHNADVVIIQEHNPRTRVLLPALRERYPHIADAMRDDAFGMAILSKFPFAETPAVYPDLGVPLTEPQIRVVLDIEGTHVVVQGVHTLPPVSFSYLREQRQLIRALAAWARTETRPVVVAGDFNCTPESMGMGWLRDAGLKEAWSQCGHGRGSTWPVGKGLFSLMGVKIDHVLLGNGLNTAEVTLGGDTNSDHRALHVKIGTRTP
jgi:endonuclease/exonuclease/phosphatase (EEP) superfamily protein YafD